MYIHTRTRQQRQSRLVRRSAGCHRVMRHPLALNSRLAPNLAEMHARNHPPTPPQHCWRCSTIQRHLSLSAAAEIGHLWTDDLHESQLKSYCIDNIQIYVYVNIYK